eukprot:2537693-Pyramimonas_sp.AAC.2
MMPRQHAPLTLTAASKCRRLSTSAGYASPGSVDRSGSGAHWSTACSLLCSAALSLIHISEPTRPEPL